MSFGVLKYSHRLYNSSDVSDCGVFYSTVSKISRIRDANSVVVSFLSRRCSPSRAGEALYPEAAAVLRPIRFCFRPSERSEMEGGEAGGAERDGRVHHSQQERHHRTHLPRGGSHGQYLEVDLSGFRRQFQTVE